MTVDITRITTGSLDATTPSQQSTIPIMSSWFNMESIQGLTSQVQNAVGKTMENIEKLEFSKIDNNAMLHKLTLTTPELTATRRKIDEEERRKEAVRDMLAGMLPWETRDNERDILVEECKEAILKLSTEKETFFGPYPMPPSVKLTSKKEKARAEGEEEVENHGEEEAAVAVLAKDHKPSKESLEKLKKLEPLPPLLQDFDLDSHVGLIQNLLKVDTKLVDMQSKLSGGGERERIFWRNYFFHCAFTRYECGLSVDELWSEDQPKAEPLDGADPNNQATATTAQEETVTFDKADEAGEAVKAFPGGEPTTDEDAPFSKESEHGSDEPALNSVNDFEMVGSEGDAAAVDDSVDYELDELEAEIARELED